jgi:choline dehydrogenase
VATPRNCVTLRPAESRGSHWIGLQGLKGKFLLERGVMINHENERRQLVLDQIFRGAIDRRGLLRLVGAASAANLLGSIAADAAFAAGDVQRANRAAPRGSYDYIIVGAGVSGSVIASEMAKSGADVLLVESGGMDDGPSITNPSVWFHNIGGPLDWSLPIQPSRRLANRQFRLSLGRVLGGGSSINAMVWSRGMQRDFDGWAASGARGWSFKDVLPIFKAQEDWEGGANALRGVGGPIHIRTPRHPHPTAPAFIEAARQMGTPIHSDLNGPMQEGAGYINMNIAADGTRISASRAFLRPNLSRRNLTLLTSTHVTKLTFTGTRCSGVELLIDGQQHKIGASREVILSAGGVGSAKLLMLSGVGDAGELRSLGIAPVADLRGVGRSYHDHVLLSGVAFEYKGKMPDRPADSNAVEAEAYLASGVDNGGVDLALILEQLPAVTPEAAARFGTPPADTFVIAPALVRSESRGTVRLASSDWQDPLIIDGNYLGTDRDLDAIVRGIELARELGSQSAFDDVRAREVVPGPNATPSDLRELAQLASASFGHPTGTCRIGTDKTAVVDPELRVHGIENLRVADSSVMPFVPAAATSAAAHMIGGKAAALLQA